MYVYVVDVQNHTNGTDLLSDSMPLAVYITSEAAIYDVKQRCELSKEEGSPSNYAVKSIEYHPLEAHAGFVAEVVYTNGRSDLYHVTQMELQGSALEALAAVSE